MSLDSHHLLLLGNINNPIVITALAITLYYFAHFVVLRRGQVCLLHNGDGIVILCHKEKAIKYLKSERSFKNKRKTGSGAYVLIITVVILIRNVSYSLRYLNTWSPVSGYVWGGF